MKIQGKITTGALCGEEIIKKYYPRIIAVVGVEPFLGTLDVQLEKEMDVTAYATKRIEHILLDGKPLVEAYLAPVILAIKTDEGEKEEPCWAFCLAKAFDKTVVELISKEKLREKYNLKDGDVVDLTFFEKTKKKKKPVTEFIKKLTVKESRISR